MNVASTWANHISGSEGQKGGSFTETVATAAVVSAGGSATAGSGSVIVDVEVTKYRLGYM